MEPRRGYESRRTGLRDEISPYGVKKSGSKKNTSKTTVNSTSSTFELSRI